MSLETVMKEAWDAVMIIIETDGSVKPADATISIVNKFTYRFTADISDHIIVKRDTIVIDGKGHTLQREKYSDSLIGIGLIGRMNVTIKNLKIKGFYLGIYLEASRKIRIIRNNIVDNEDLSKLG